MSNPKIKEYDSDGNEIVRDLSQKEIETILELDEKQKLLENKLQKNRESAFAKLVALGLTEEEIAAL